MSVQTPKGEFCYGCGRICTGVHLDYHLLPPCTASFVVLDAGVLTSYKCQGRQGHWENHRDGEKEWK